MAPSRISLEEQEVVAFLSKWWIPVAVMGSLLMQLLLLLTGGTRKWNLACRLVAWNAYNWSDYIATTALGGLAQAAVGGTHKEVYAIWAPMLLMHLGAPDNISAYTMADAELWQRSSLTMLLQLTTTIYVVANCARVWEYVLLSICLTAIGSMKYAERILALKRASRADIIESTLPIYKYMLAEASLNLDIRGAVNGQNPISSVQSLPASRGTPHPTPCYYYILRGEKKWLRNFLQAGETNYIHSYRDAAKATPELVTLQDILSSRQLSRTPSTVLLCVGFALFKLYKRRLSSLYMYEWRQAKNRDFFLKKDVFQNVKEIIFVLDAELRFLFDSLYTKAAGTAFSKLGISFRITTVILLVVSSVFIFAGYLDFHQQGIQQGRKITFSLIAVALVIEAYQLARLALSDWSRVWLACTYIVVAEKLQKRSGWSVCYCLRSFWLAALLKMIRISGRLGRHKYWRSRIGQYAMVDADNQSTWWSVNSKMAGLIGHNQLQLLPEYEHSTQAVDEFRTYVLTKALTACQEIGINQNFSHPAWFLPRYENRNRHILQAALGNSNYFDFEHLVVTWHLATCVCELLAAHPPVDHLQRGGAGTGLHVTNKSDSAPVPPGTEDITLVDLRMSKLLSRYLMYLLVHKTELLPCHANIARELAADTERDMRTIIWNAVSIIPVLTSMAQNSIDSTLSMPSNLRNGMKVGSLVQALPSEVRWRLLADVWVDILLCAAATNKPIEHLQQLTVGGEFLTHLWVLLGHMGCGAQGST